MDQLDDYINKVKHLPPAPTVLPQLLLLLGQADSDIGQVIELIHYDPSLTANVLQACNSVYFGGATRIDNVELAVTRLGFQEVYRMVAAVTVGGAFAPAKKSYGIEAGALWEHSVITAGA